MVADAKDVPVDQRASGDDTTGYDDEDGVELGAAGMDVTISVADHTSARYGPELWQQLYLDGFVDANNDGDFDDLGEHFYSQAFDVSDPSWTADANPNDNQHLVTVPLPPGFKLPF